MIKSLLLLIFSLAYGAAALAFTVDTPLADAAQETRAKALFAQVRCVVCQGESVADSPAEVARDMRSLIRAQVAQGKTDNDIRAYLVAHYGDGILMQPPLNESTALLWFGPLAIVLLALLLAVRYVFRKPDGNRVV